MSFSHISVLLKETVDKLEIKPDGVYVDGTLGGGGHSYEIASRLSDRGRLIGIDQDGDAVLAASKRLAEFGNLITIVRSNYRHMKKILEELQVDGADGILLDLGVSSYQLDTAERGFSYMEDAPLDMRMDQRESRTAKEIVNGYSEQKLFQMIRDYGEDRFAGNIARQIVRTREHAPIETTKQLSEIICNAVPAKARRIGGHPAKRTFQAIRIELNRELEVLQDTLEDMIELLTDRGRICVITFHSLEDRIVKNAFKKAENPCICPPGFPVCTCGRKPLGVVITKKPILPSKEEIEQNSRSKSAKLRVFERRLI